MNHLVAYFESIAASQTDSDLNALQGQGDFVVNNHQVFPDDRWVAMAYASGVGLTQARLTSPTIRQVAPIQLRPFARSLLPVSFPLNIASFRRNPIRIKRDEELQILVTTDATAGPNNMYGLLWLHDGDYSIPSGPEYVIRATGTTTVTASAWSLCAMTYQDTLPQGRYAIVGMNANAATGVAARLVFVGSQIWRPGCLCGATGGTTIYPAFYGLGDGWDPMGLGRYGEFSTIYMPNAEFLCNAADTAQELILRCRKVA